MYTVFIKRLLDFLGACMLLAFLWPIMLGIGIALLLAGNGVLFIQPRIGKNASIFNLYKFKTMRNEKDGFNELERIFSLGMILRKSSLDELPQLINILKGEMSFIGPRPLLPEYLPLYSNEQAKRHSVMPGITGWAQVKGRNTISWQQRFDLDLYYIQHRGFLLDFKIMVLTVLAIFFRQGKGVDNGSLMEKFKG